jgi:hypothetical protein
MIAAHTDGDGRRLADVAAVGACLAWRLLPRGTINMAGHDPADDR